MPQGLCPIRAIFKAKIGSVDKREAVAVIKDRAVIRVRSARATHRITRA